MKNKIVINKDENGIFKLISFQRSLKILPEGEIRIIEDEIMSLPYNEAIKNFQKTYSDFVEIEVV